MGNTLNKPKVTKALGLLGALSAGAGLIMSGQHVEGIGVIAAALSSASIFDGGPSPLDNHRLDP